MLIISNVLGESIYEGAHPITGKDIKVKWKEFTQEELWGFIDLSPNNKWFFEPESSFFRPEITETVKTKQTENVNTTAPSTRATGSTVTTTATKGAVSEG
jgi:hypothetical protein